MRRRLTRRFPDWRLTGVAGIVFGGLLWIIAANADRVFNSADAMGAAAVVAGIGVLFWPKGDEEA